MTLTLLQLLVLQVAVLLTTYVFLFRKTELPLSLKVIVLATYTTVPLALLVKGVQSAIYASDFILPMLLLSGLLSSRESRWTKQGLVVALLLLIVVLPFILAFFQGIVGDQRGGLGSRNVKGDIVWIYRNLSYVAVLGYGLSLRLTAEQVVSFVHMNIVLAGTLAAMGFASYFGPVNLAIFEELAWKEWVEEGYQGSRIGLGFMGLFRASVGQWFAMVTVLIAGTYVLLSRSYKFIAVPVMGACIAMILMSQSRAGLVGLGVGLILLSLLAEGVVPKVMALMGGGGMAAWIVLKPDMFAARAVSIISGTQNAHDRVQAWERAYDFFTHHVDAFLLGVGPANRDAVFKAIGAYGAHNEYIDVLFRLGFVGLVGLIGFLIVLVMTLWAARHQFEADGHAILTTATILVMANCVMGMTQEHLLHDYASHTMGVFIYLFYGIMLGIKSPFEQEEEYAIEESAEASWDAESGYANAPVMGDRG